MFRRTLPLALFGALLLGAGVLAWSGGGARTARAISNCDTSEAAVTPAEQQMLDLINQARAQNGAGPLKFSPNLNRAAAWKSADSSAYGATFSHQDSLGRWPVPGYGPPPLRTTDCGYPSWAAEDLAYGSPDAVTIFNMWRNSPGHWANIIDPTMRVIGIGAHTFPGITTAWTADFGQFDDSGSLPPSTTATQPASASPTATSTRTPSPTASPTPSPAPLPLIGVQLTLSPGMNLVTYGGPEQPVMAALASIRSAVLSVYAWDSAAGRWAKYAPGLPAYVDSFTTFRPGRVYYLQLSAPAFWTY